MNCFYEDANARLCLNSFIAKTKEGNNHAKYLGNLKVAQTTVELFDQPTTLRMTQEVGGQSEEVVVVIPGIIGSKMLPPIERPLKIKGDAHVGKLRQSVKLTGLGSLPFNDLAGKVDEVVEHFKAAFPKDNIQPPTASPHEGEFALDLHTRYFTDRRKAPNQKHIPFPPDIDPFHILESICGSKFIHSPDNQVQYGRKIIIDGQGSSYEMMNPGLFKEGDVVEATVCFVAYRLQESEYKMVLSLRALSLLSSKIREKSQRVQDEKVVVGGKRRMHEGSSKPKKPLKRQYIAMGVDSGMKID